MTFIHLDPLTFRWQDWRARVHALDTARRQTPHTAPAMLAVVSQWTADTDAWLRSLTSNQRRDFGSLLRAENDMLFDLINPGHSPKPPDFEWEWSDFRERFYAAMPGVRALERLADPAAPGLLMLYHDLHDYGVERGWLP